MISLSIFNLNIKKKILCKFSSKYLGAINEALTCSVPRTITKAM